MAERAVPELAGRGGRGQHANMLNTDQLLVRAISERPRQSTEPLVPGTPTGLFRLLSSISPEEQVSEAGPAGELQPPSGILGQKRPALAKALEETRLELRSW